MSSDPSNSNEIPSPFNSNCDSQSFTPPPKGPKSSSNSPTHICESESGSRKSYKSTPIPKSTSLTSAKSGLSSGSESERSLIRPTIRSRKRLFSGRLSDQSSSKSPERRSENNNRDSSKSSSRSISRSRSSNFRGQQESYETDFPGSSVSR